MGMLDALDPSPFGLNIHTADELLPVFTGIGIRWFRIDANWHEIEPEQGQFDWSPIDRMLDAAEEAGASVLASVAYTPSWASAEARRAGLPEAAWPGLPPADPESFVRFVQAFTERYAIRLAAISIWNEPDHEKFWRGSQEEHVALLVPALRKVRAARAGSRDVRPRSVHLEQGILVGFLEGQALSTVDGTHPEGDGLRDVRAAARRRLTSPIRGRRHAGRPGLPDRRPCSIPAAAMRAHAAAVDHRDWFRQRQGHLAAAGAVPDRDDGSHGRSPRVVDEDLLVRLPWQGGRPGGVGPPRPRRCAR